MSAHTTADGKQRKSTMKLGRTTFIHFTTLVVVSAAGFLSRFAIGFFLGEEVLGQYSIAIGIGFYWFVIPGTAIAQAMTKRVSEGEEKGAFLTAGFGINAITAVIIGAGILAAGTLLKIFFPDSSVPFVSVLSESKELVAGLAVTAILFRTAKGGLNGQKQVALSGIVNAVERVLRTGSQLAFILAGLGLVGLLAGHAASLLLAALLAVYLFDIRFQQPTTRHAREILRFGQYGWASTLQGRVFGWMDVLVLSFFVTDGLIGIYEAAWGFGSLLAILSTSISTTLFPEISDLATDKQFAEIRHYLGEGIVFAGLFVIPGLFGAVVIGERLLEIYRPSFGKGAPILVILIFAYVGDVYATQFVNTLNAIDRPDVTYHVNILFILSNLVLNVILIWQFGWFGAAVATAFSTWLRATLSYVELERYVGRPDVPFSAIRWEVAASAVMAFLVWNLNQFAPGTRVYTFLLVMVGATVYTALMVILSPLVRQKGINIARDITSLL